MHSSLHQSVTAAEALWVAEFFLSLSLLALLHFRKANAFFWVRSFLWFKVLSDALLYGLAKYKPFGHSPMQYYNHYFFCYWACYAIESILCFMILRELFLKSLEPLEGLRHLGQILFLWIAGVAAVVALTVALGPAQSAVQFFVLAISQFQKCQSVLQLSLLIFVFMVARPLGVTSKHGVFGATIGFSLLALSDLSLLVGWIHSSTMLSGINLFHAAALPMALCIWIFYACLPEPKRVPVMLPVTSSLLRWNEVCMALGKPGGHIVVVGQEEILKHDIGIWNRAMDVVGAERIELNLD